MITSKHLQPVFWNSVFLNEYKKPYFNKIISFIEQQSQLNTIYPNLKDVYNAFNYTDFKDIKVVLIGQDPYHGINQAHGLSFSVQNGVKIPPSLKNIFKELNTDLNLPIPQNGNLSNWAKQGVLLLNASLTVSAGLAGSHQNIGWEVFTDNVIKHISVNKTHCVFLLWGNFAKSKAYLIDENKHLILQAAHPSPLARGAFFGNKHFSKTNNYLISKKIQPINWDISSNTLFSATDI